MLITHNMKNKKLLLGIAWAWLTLPVGKCGSEIARFLFQTAW